MIVFLLFLSLFSTSWAKEPRSVTMIEEDMSPPEGYDDVYAKNARNVFVTWMSMPLDHFDHQNPTMFSMRYMFNEEFFGGDGYPIFILAGGEWSIQAGWLLAGNMYEMARENKGFQVYTEHRYYGATQIFSNFTAENLRFLNIDQALADLAYFITEIKKQPRFAESEVIMYGGSYAANMVMWFKKRYPHLVLGTVASSGPILAKVDFPEYLEVVHEAFTLEGGEECIGHIRRGLDDTLAAMQTESGRRLLERSYRLCQPLDYDNEYALAVFSGLISWTFSTSVQQARPGTLQSVCKNFTDHTSFGATPMEKIGGYIAITRGLGANSCWSSSYDNFLNNYQNATNSRAWYYQTCTEYGYYQTAPSSGTVFDGLKWLSLDFYTDVCKKIFDERFDLAFVEDGARRVNLIFGGLEPVVNNTINIHGYIDPWRALGVYKDDISETSPTYTVNRASHCFDMQGWLRTDTIEMTAVQQRARRTVTSWLSKAKAGTS
ncbi:hypothetical protein PYW07_001749 [Mythimna separata]|uniref:Serine protease K12H4.7 n=1 Tax=Mythimna separata TaxID=271217 RepID=A0AAD7YTX8_MYTSE|nr:hypothetical protein PYW07_001749 [Mythimna separata]